MAGCNVSARERFAVAERGIGGGRGAHGGRTRSEQAASKGRAFIRGTDEGRTRDGQGASEEHTGGQGADERMEEARGNGGSSYLAKQIEF